MPSPFNPQPIQYARAAAAVAVCTGLARLMHQRLDPSNLIMVYLLGVVWSAVRYGRGPSIFASVLSVAAFDYFYVPPYFSFSVTDSQYLLTFAVMLLIAVLLSTLVTRVRTLALESDELLQRAELERLRSSLLSSVSHDLRTPLATITGAASGLKETPEIISCDRTRELVDVIYEEAYRLERFVTNLLSMTRLQSGALSVSKEWQPLEEVVGCALTRLEERLNGRSLHIELPDSLPLVPLDGILIEQVLVNLLDNALKYGGADTRLSISAVADQAQVTVLVADNGPGIKQGEQEKIFEKFYRGKPNAAAGGAGLGLAICRGIVEAHGGKIWCEANVPEGCVFKFTLPLEGHPPSI